MPAVVRAPHASLSPLMHETTEGQDRFPPFAAAASEACREGGTVSTLGTCLGQETPAGAAERWLDHPAWGGTEPWEAPFLCPCHLRTQAIRPRGVPGGGTSGRGNIRDQCWPPPSPQSLGREGQLPLPAPPPAGDAHWPRAGAAGPSVSIHGGTWAEGWAACAGSPSR